MTLTIRILWHNASWCSRPWPRLKCGRRERFVSLQTSARRDREEPAPGRTLLQLTLAERETGRGTDCAHVRLGSCLYAGGLFHWRQIMSGSSLSVKKSVRTYFIIFVVISKLWIENLEVWLPVRTSPNRIMCVRIKRMMLAAAGGDVAAAVLE